jgi:TPP-dependent pyruvate/acetoin dehydrogenase alpha subunit
MNKQELIDFEKEVQKIYESGEIKAPVHLSGNNEDELIDIFKNIDKDDWVFSNWRNHYHALLHGFEPAELLNLIKEGRSMGINSEKNKFYSSSIVGGSLPIALGVAQSIKLRNQTNKVWCFIGDMTFETGVFHECYKFSRNFKLPLEFVIEDNNMSTNTPTDETWAKKSQIPDDVYYYKYERNFPHHGTGNWVLF